jgi:hypothetical protein
VAALSSTTAPAWALLVMLTMSLVPVIVKTTFWLVV